MVHADKNVVKRTRFADDPPPPPPDFRRRRSSIAPGGPGHRASIQPSTRRRTSVSGRTRRSTVHKRGSSASLHDGGQEIYVNPVEVQQALAAMPIFSSCRSGFVEALAAEATALAYGPGADIVREGEEGDALMILHAGLAVKTLGGIRLEDVFPGQSVGEMVFLGLATSWPVTLSTIGGAVREDTVVISIPAAGFNFLLGSHPMEKASFAGIRGRHFVHGRGHVTPQEGTLVNTWGMFRTFSQEVLEAIDGRVVTRLYFPGERVMIERAACEDLFILANGWCSVELDGRVLREELVDIADKQRKERDPTVFGEAGLVGVTRHSSATVVAQSACEVRVLYKVLFKALLNDSPSLSRWTSLFKGQEDGALSSHVGATRCLRELPLFLKIGCSEEFLRFLAEHLEDRIFLSGHRLICEGTKGDRTLYVLRAGSVKIDKGGQVMSRLGGEQVVGEYGALGLEQTRTFSMTATSICFVQVLAHNIVLKAMELFPEERIKVFELCFEKMKQDAAALEDEDGEMPMRPAPSIHMPNLVNGDQVISGIPFFAGMRPACFEEVKRFARERVYMAGDRILEQGKLGDSMFIIITGMAAVYSARRSSVSTDDDSFSRRSSLASTRRRSSAASRLLRDGQTSPDGRRRSSAALSDVASQRRRSSSRMSFLEQAEQMLEGLAAPACQRSVTPAEPVVSREISEHKMSSRPFDLSSATKVANLQSGSIVGEMAMLGLSKFRMATILAESICFCWELTRKDAMKMVDSQPEARSLFQQNICKSLEDTVNPRLSEFPLIADYGRQFVAYIAMGAETKAYFEKDVIVSDGEPCPGWVLINQGSALLCRKGVQIKRVPAGSHFGSVSAAVSTCTLVAEQTCHAIIISPQAFERAARLSDNAEAMREAQKAESNEARLLARQTASILRQERSVRRASLQEARSRAAEAILESWREGATRKIAAQAFSRWAGLAMRVRTRAWTEAQRTIEVNFYAVRSARAKEVATSRLPQALFDPDGDERWPLVPVPPPPRSPKRGPGFSGSGFSDFSPRAADTSNSPVRARRPLMHPSNPYCKALALHVQDGSRGHSRLEDSDGVMHSIRSMAASSPSRSSSRASASRPGSARPSSARPSESESPVRRGAKLQFVPGHDVLASAAAALSGRDGASRANDLRRTPP